MVSQTNPQRVSAQSTVFLVNGDTYRGEWNGANKHGNGIYHYAATGSVYEGEWRNNQRHGYGTFSIKESTPTTTQAGINPMRKVYAGEWACGKRHGRGTHFFKDGSRYDGFWASDARQGFGKMEFANGDVYEGEWKDGKRCGHGILLLGNGDRYEGAWLEDMKDGLGQFIYKYKRQVYDGEWAHDVPKCGTVMDLPPLIGHPPKKHPLPKICLEDPMEVLRTQMNEIQIDRRQRIAASDL
ncbi:hypothetical protein SmJEL517_g03999 [Synchytrium microbalum]|uniref:MORN repeat-containing protein 3 n=1 Tax=Synchytrium microbalum TaxID=1806994 RepID=A0A507BTX4_9FUNG|nr:uncharacterized protein SmJEL517_g03999 [Synchytrium microbalum]TPX32970.1 hypothetical protein SmJEL517_g03999 [Synchytrium microbalum]